MLGPWFSTCVSIIQYSVNVSCYEYGRYGQSPLCVICLYAATNLLVSEVLDEVLLHTIPMVLGGDFNTDLKSTEGTEFLEFLRDTWKLELISDPAI